jgi:hypothetical protein
MRYATGIGSHFSQLVIAYFLLLESNALPRRDVKYVAAKRRNECFRFFVCELFDSASRKMNVHYRMSIINLNE